MFLFFTELTNCVERKKKMPQQQQQQQQPKRASRITHDDLSKYGQLFGHIVKSREAAERNQKIRAEIDEAKRACKHLKSSNLEEFKIAKVKH